MLGWIAVIIAGLTLLGTTIGAIIAFRMGVFKNTLTGSNLADRLDKLEDKQDKDNEKVHDRITGKDKEFKEREKEYRQELNGIRDKVQTMDTTLVDVKGQVTHLVKDVSTLVSNDNEKTKAISEINISLATIARNGNGKH